MSVKSRKLKDGTTVYDAILEYGYDLHGKRARETKTFRTRKEALEADAKAKETANALKNKTGRLTLKEYIDRCYWPIASRRLAATSLDTYEREIEKRIIPYLGNMSLDKIDRFSIQKMLDGLDSYSVAKKTLQTLKTILNESVDDGFIITNPACSRFAYPPKKNKRDNGLVLSTFEDIGSFIGVVIKDGSEPITRLVLTGLLLGLRPEERYALDYEDIDFKNRLVRVNKAYVTVSPKRGSHAIKETKTAFSTRTVPMPQAFIDYVYYDDEGTGAYIRNKSGDRLSPSTGRKMWVRFLDKHPELPKITLENMRHSYATSCLHAGMEISDLSRILGHSDINTTYRRYVKPQFSDMQKSMVSIDAIVT